jgi:hypothetical protein
MGQSEDFYAHDRPKNQEQSTGRTAKATALLYLLRDVSYWLV